MNSEGLLTRSSHPALLGSAWRFGLVLVLLPLLSSLVDCASIAMQDSDVLQDIDVLRDVIVPVLSRFAGRALGIFAAGIVAYSLVSPRPDGRLAKTVLLAGVGFVLVFPFAGVALAAIASVSVALSGGELLGGRDLVGYVGFNWWSDFRDLGVPYFLGIAFCSAVYLSVSPPSPRPSRVDRDGMATGRRPVDLVAGMTLIVAGAAIALTTYLAFGEQGADDAVGLQGELWDVVAVRCLPFLFVGSLLLSRSDWLPRRLMRPP